MANAPQEQDAQHDQGTARFIANASSTNQYPLSAKAVDRDEDDHVADQQTFSSVEDSGFVPLAYGAARQKLSRSLSPTRPLPRRARCCRT